jgi:hypothetical protein
MDVNGKLHAPAALCPKKEPRLPLELASGPESQPARYGERKLVDPTETRR